MLRTAVCLVYHAHNNTGSSAVSDPNLILGSDDEINQELGFVGAGILAMANAGPNTNGEGHLSSFVPNENGCLGLGYARPVS
jgi:hypothetical protein